MEQTAKVKTFSALKNTLNSPVVIAMIVSTTMLLLWNMPLASRYLSGASVSGDIILRIFHLCEFSIWGIYVVAMPWIVMVTGWLPIRKQIKFGVICGGSVLYGISVLLAISPAMTWLSSIS